MESFIIKPILGLKTNVPANDITLFNEAGMNHAVGGQNFDIRRTRHASTKSFGKLQWSAGSVPMAPAGSNLITNGAAWTGATGATPPTGWAVVTAGTFTITDSGDGAPYDACLKIEVDATPTEDPAVVDAITTVVGKTYRLSFAFKHGTGTSGLVYAGTTSGGSELYNSGALTDAAWATHTYDFQATTTTTYITLTTDSPTVTQFELFDTVTFYELASGTSYCLGMIECVTGGNTSRWSFHGNDSDLGVVVRWNDSRYPLRVSDIAGHSGAVAFAYNSLDYYCALDFGGYMIFTDYGEHTPYKSDYNDTVLTKLIQAGTEYKYRYLEQFHGRVLGAYSDQTNGHIEIRYTNSLISADPWSGLSFPAANQLYRPNDDSITGIKRMGMNACFLYGENSIDRIDYYANYEAPFGLTNMVTGTGSVNHWSIVDAGGRHFLFDRNYGFIEYRGGMDSRSISDTIEEDVAQINTAYYGHIIGKQLRHKNQIVWTVPSAGATEPDKLFIYDLFSGQWTIESHAARFVDGWVVVSDVTWQDLINLGYVTWEDFGTMRWADLVTQTPSLVLSNADGHIYHRTGESDAGSAWDGYRIEPVLDFGSPEDKDLLLEIWFGIAAVGDFSLYVSHRSGDTLGECINAGWSILDEVSCNSPSNAVTRLAETGRYHQIKWGTDLASEAFSVNSIEFKYVRQGRY